MSYLILRDHKAFVFSEKFDEATKKHYTCETEVTSLASYLTTKVEIKDNFTFGDLWHFIEIDSAIYGLVFSEAMGNFPIEFYIDDAKRSPNPVKHKQHEMNYLEVYWDVNHSKGQNSNIFDVYPCFHGVGPDLHSTVGADIGWAIDFTPISDLLKYPLKLNKLVKVYPIGFVKGRKTVVNAERYFSLFDVLHTILYEITFCGTPAHRDEQEKVLIGTYAKEQK